MMKSNTKIPETEIDQGKIEFLEKEEIMMKAKENLKIPETDQEKMEFLINVLNLTRDEAEMIMHNTVSSGTKIVLTQEEYDYMQKYGMNDPAIPGIVEKAKKRGEEYFGTDKDK